MSTKSLPNVSLENPELTEGWVEKNLGVSPETAKVLIRYIVAVRTRRIADNADELAAARSALKKLGSEWKLLQGQMESLFLR